MFIRYLVPLIALLISAIKVQAQFYKEFYKQSAYEASLVKKAGYRRMVEKDLLSKDSARQVGEELYNEDGKLVKLEKEVESKYIIRESYTYHSNGAIKSVEHQSAMVVKGSTYSIQFTNQGIPISVTWTEGRQGDKKVCIVAFKYTETDRLQVGKEFSAEGKSFEYKSFTWYNSQYKVAEWLRTDSKGDTIGWQKTSYDSFGMPIVEVNTVGSKYVITKEHYKPDYYDSTTISYTRNKAGTIIHEIRNKYKIEYKTKIAKQSFSPKREISFNDKGQRTRILDYELNMKGGVELRYVASQTYNEDGLPDVYTVAYAKGGVILSSKRYYFKD